MCRSQSLISQPKILTQDHDAIAEDGGFVPNDLAKGRVAFERSSAGQQVLHEYSRVQSTRTCLSNTIIQHKNMDGYYYLHKVFRQQCSSRALGSRALLSRARNTRDTNSCKKEDPRAHQKGDGLSFPKQEQTTCVARVSVRKPQMVSLLY